MEKGLNRKPEWRLEDQDWWVNYSEQVNAGVIEACDSHPMAAATGYASSGSGSYGSGSLYVRSSGSYGSGSGSLYVRSSGTQAPRSSASYYVYSSGSYRLRNSADASPDEELINHGVMAYGLDLI